MTYLSPRLLIGTFGAQHADRLRRSGVELQVEPILYAERVSPGQVVHGEMNPPDVALATRAGAIVLWGEDERIATAESPLLDPREGVRAAVLALSDAELCKAARAELESQGIRVRVAPEALQNAMDGIPLEGMEFLVAQPTVPEAARIGPYVHAYWATEGRPEDGVEFRALLVTLTENLARQMRERMERARLDAALARECRRQGAPDKGGEALFRHVSSALLALSEARRVRLASSPT